MNFVEICIRRPVLAIVINLVIILLGLVAYERLTIREYPNIDVPVVTVTTTYRGASASIVETQVTKPLEDSLSGIEGIDFIKSISRSENSQITVQFRLDRDADNAAADVRDRVARARDLLPDEVDEPVTAKVEADAQPIIWMAVSSDRHDALEVSEYADLVVQDRIQTMPGVANVMLFAERRYAMRVNLNPEKLAAYNLLPADVEQAIRSQNVEIPAGRIESTDREFTVLAQTDLNTPDEFKNIIIKQAGSHSVRLRDVADVKLGPLEERQIARFNGRPTIALGVVKQSVANPLEISKSIRKALPEINAVLPEGMKAEIAYDSSVFIDASIKAVFHAIFEAIGLVLITIFLFLRSGRATLIPMATLPVTLIGALGMMYALGFTINTLTLLSIVLAIGLVVDDAIVVLENSYRHIERGLDPLHATVKSMREITFAVIAMTVTLAAVFAPIGFSTGRTGKLFTEFALTLAGAVLISGVVALTLSPMMCSRMLKGHDASDAGWSRAIDRFLRWLDTSYKWTLRGILRSSRVVALFVLLVIVGAGALFMTIPKELTPAEDRGIIFAVAIAPEGGSLAYSDRYVQMMEGIFEQQVKEKAWNFVAIGFPFVTQTFYVMGAKNWDDRDRSTMDIVQSISPMLFGIPGTLNFAINPPSLGESPTSRPIEFVIQTTGDYQKLNDVVSKVMAEMAKNPGFVQPDSDLKLNKPELRISVDRNRLAELGIPVDVVGRTLETMLGGREVTRFKQKGEQYDVLVKMDDARRQTPDDLLSIQVPTASGEMVPLRSLVTLRETVAPRELNHFDKLRAATISANLVPGFAQGDALKFMEDTTRKVDPSALVNYSGTSREFKLSSSSLAFIFVLALLFIYLVLAAQFESFVDPIIILLAVPLAISGALLTMKLTGNTLNIYTQIGLVTLMGLIAKHGIMIVEFANQLQEEGLEKAQAVLHAASVRLRPILMTTSAMVLGAVPLAFAEDAGAESRSAIGLVIVGGMSIGTLFTVFVVPALYALMASHRKLVVIDESKLV